MLKELLMVFVRNAVIGSVKTRLAAVMGDQAALAIYKILLQHTLSISSAVVADKMVLYSDYVEDNDVWQRHGFIQQRQEGKDLGEKMLHAFRHAQERGYTNIIVFGSDCLELSTPILQTAFDALRSYDVVMGPARDGGYYLLGCKAIPNGIFDNKHWSTDTVLRDTLEDIRRAGMKVSLLPRLSDVDEFTDLPAAWRTGVSA